MEPVIIEDLVKFGEDRGLLKGERKGRRRHAREALRRVFALRKLELTAEQARQIATCMDIGKLDRWHDQAIFATTADEALR